MSRISDIQKNIKVNSKKKAISCGGMWIVINLKKAMKKKLKMLLR